MGFFEENLADGRNRHGETVTCAHCNGVFEVRDNDGLFVAPTMCSMEHKPLCPKCASRADKREDGMCEVFEKKLDKIEARAKLLRAAGLEP
jgi:hypothetical protein